MFLLFVSLACLVSVSSLIWMIHGIIHAPIEQERLDGSVYLAESRSVLNPSGYLSLHAAPSNAAHSPRMR